MPSFGSRVTSITQDKFLPKAVWTVLNKAVMPQRFLRAAKKWAGESLKVPYIHTATAQGGSFFGFDTLNTNAVDTRETMSFTPSFVYEPVTVSLTELSVNKTSETQVIDLMAISMEEAAYRFQNSLNTMFWADGTGNSSKDILGMAAHVDDGNTVSTYGGKSRSTYTGLASTVTASGGALTLAKMATLWSVVSSGSDTPTIIYTTETVFNLYEQLLQPQERITKSTGNTKGIKAGTGFTALEYKGKPVVADEFCTSGVMLFLNEEYLDWYALPMAMTEAVKYKPQTEGLEDDGTPTGLGFSFSGWIQSQNQAAITGRLYLGGQFINRLPRRSGKLTGITSV